MAKRSVAVIYERKRQKQEMIFAKNMRAQEKQGHGFVFWDLILCTLDEDCLQSVLSESSHRMISVYYDWDLEHEISPLLLEILTEKQRAGLQKVFLLHFLSIL